MKEPLSLVIPVKSGSKCNHKDFIYAIRSAVNNFNFISDIFILGEKINSLQGVKYINVKDDKGYKWKERNIYRKIMEACKHPEVSERFCFLNDDHYILKNYDDLPYYNKGDLQHTMSKNVGNDYRSSLNHSYKILKSKGLPTIDFDTHFPIIYDKSTFICTFESINWDLEYGYVIKSLYCGLNGIEGEYIGDCKIQRKCTYDEIKNIIKDKPFFSTSDASMTEDMFKVLEELYPEKSKYER